MSLLAPYFDAQLQAPIDWADDRGQQTPACFGAAEQEYQALVHGVGIVDLTHGGVVSLSGPDRFSFLSGLITNQINRVDEHRSIYAALLTPQGRYLWDFTVVQQQDQLLLCTEPDRVEDLCQHLQHYVLRSKVKLANMSDQVGMIAVVGPQAAAFLATLFPVVASSDSAELGWTGLAMDGVLLWHDPRHTDFGWRLLVPAGQLPLLWDSLLNLKARAVGWLAWERYRIDRALPRGGSELIVDTSLPLESGLLEMQGVDFTKGCYVGQETTSRSHHRATLKKRLYHIELVHEDPSVEPGSVVALDNGREVGVVTSWSGSVGLAILRSQEVQEAAGVVQVAATRATARKPAWAGW
ncbi:MAG: folate-binding protein YgfZ [Magnetococcales bacterium]|nr:folate-binding protein YgfZ [Magnetococcales bacterium]